MRDRQKLGKDRVIQGDRKRYKTAVGNDLKKPDQPKALLRALPVRTLLAISHATTELT
jgi:hypothetical protein